MNHKKQKDFWQSDLQTFNSQNTAVGFDCTTAERQDIRCSHRIYIHNACPLSWRDNSHFMCAYFLLEIKSGIFSFISTSKVAPPPQFIKE